MISAPPAAADARNASNTSMQATPSQKVGAATVLLNSRPSTPARKTSHKRVTVLFPHRLHVGARRRSAARRSGSRIRPANCALDRRDANRARRASRRRHFHRTTNLASSLRAMQPAVNNSLRSANAVRRSNHLLLRVRSIHAKAVSGIDGRSNA